ncbi:MAG: ribokinase [Oscillospiraceae bacterium]|jgi:ribokinase|nr:ribokinase [Oscillospiraceae bacterium]
MPSICVAGSLNMDLCVETPRVPAMGETVLGGGFSASPGGKGANQAVAAARLGACVAMLGRAGGDAFGARLIENLRANGVGTEHIRITQDAPTGVAVILLHNRDNCIVVDPGANALLSPEDISGAEGVIAASDVLVLQLEIPPDTARRAMELARAHGVTVLLNPAPAQRLPADFLALADILTPNRSESEILTGEADAEQAARALLRMGIPRVVVTLGGKGVLYSEGGRMVRKPACPARAVDTTAAGDCFTGALAAALAGGAEFGRAVGFAQAAAALAVTRRGAQESLPTLAQVERFSPFMSC